MQQINSTGKILLYFAQQHLSASLRNNGCKCLRSRPKRSITLSIKPYLSLLFFSQQTLITHKPSKVCLTMLIRATRSWVPQGNIIQGQGSTIIS